MSDVPEPEDYSHKEIYTFFGLAAFHAQAMEKGLVNLCAAFKASGLQITWAQFDEIFAGYNSKTLGQLLTAARKLAITIPDESLSVLEAATRARNFLNHDFFWQYAAHWESLSGRKHMLQKLTELTDQFQTANDAVEAICQPIIENMGVTEEILQRCEQELLIRSHEIH